MFEDISVKIIKNAMPRIGNLQTRLELTECGGRHDEGDAGRGGHLHRDCIEVHGQVLVKEDFPTEEWQIFSQQAKSTNCNFITPSLNAAGGKCNCTNPLCTGKLTRLAVSQSEARNMLQGPGGGPDRRGCYVIGCAYVMSQAARQSGHQPGKQNPRVM